MKRILTILSFISLSILCSAQIDSVRFRDFGNLNDIILKNLKIPDSILYKPKGEIVILTFSFKDNQVENVEVWHTESRFLHAVCIKMIDQLKQWHPEYQFPPTLYYPICITFTTPNSPPDTRPCQLLENIRELQTDKFLIVRGLVYSFMAKPYPRSDQPSPFKNKSN